MVKLEGCSKEKEGRRKGRGEPGSWYASQGNQVKNKLVNVTDWGKGGKYQAPPWRSEVGDVQLGGRKREGGRGEHTHAGTRDEGG